MQLSLFAVGAAIITEAAAQEKTPAVHWTLHTSCYEGPGKNILEHKMVEAVAEAKKWADNAASKMSSGVTKATIDALCGGRDDVKKTVIDNFKKIAYLQGPIGVPKQIAGKEAPGPKYWESAEWLDLRKSDEHWKNVIIVCSPDLEGDEDPAYDIVRQMQLPKNHVFVQWKKLAKQEDSDWDKLGSGPRIKALTQRDGGKGRPDTRTSTIRLRVPQSINLHPLWIKHMLSGQTGWSPDLYEKVTDKKAEEAYRLAGMEKNRHPGLKPADGLITASFTATVLHELFHLYAFGDMMDENNNQPAYGFFNNKIKNSATNPDLYAIIGVIVELANQGGQKYIVDAEGLVTKAGS